MQFLANKLAYGASGEIMKNNIKKIILKIKKQVTAKKPKLHEVEKPNFSRLKRICTLMPPGTAKALIKIERMGEAITNIEVVDIPLTREKFKQTYITTGTLSKVTQESIDIAMVVAKNYVKKVDPTNTFLYNSYLHIHVPPGDNMKYGPCAGVSIATALISLAIGQAINENILMAGELSLYGKIIGVNCIKDKIVTAMLDTSIQHLILPKRNIPDVYKLDVDYIKENNINIYFVSTFDDVYHICFKQGSRPKQNYGSVSIMV